jgi:high-affinity nickel permease
VRRRIRDHWETGKIGFRHGPASQETCYRSCSLFALALVNILVLVSVYRTFQAVKRGEPFR